MSSDVHVEPAEVRNLARELLVGMKSLLGCTQGMAKSLDVMAQSFQDDGLAEYSDTVYRIQTKLGSLVENELDVAVKSLTEFANLLEQAKRA